MLLTVFTAGQPGVRLEIKPAEAAPAGDILVVLNIVPLAARELDDLPTAQRPEEYEVIPLARHGIYALYVRKAILEHFGRDRLLALIRPLATNALLPAPLASIRLVDPPVPETKCAALTVGSIMQRDLVCASPEESIAAAARRMNERRVGCLPVLRGEVLVGLITSRDLRQAAPDQKVREVMTQKLITVSEEAFLGEAQRLMEAGGVERLPVVRGNRLVGLVTKADVLRRLGYETDPLTGLKTSVYARWYAQSLLAADKEVAVVFIDLNDFGRVNKVYGHGFGDRVLVEMAEVLKNRTDPQRDLPGRYGGDEFIIVTTRPLAAARQIASDILVAIAEIRLSEGGGISASAGIAGGRRLAPRPGTHPAATVDDIINLASLASTEAKRQKVPLLVAGEYDRDAAART